MIGAVQNHRQQQGGATSSAALAGHHLPGTDRPRCSGRSAAGIEQSYAAIAQVALPQLLTICSPLFQVRAPTFWPPPLLLNGFLQHAIMICRQSSSVFCSSLRPFGKEPITLLKG